MVWKLPIWIISVLSILFGCASMSQKMRAPLKTEREGMFIGTVVMVPSPDTIWMKDKSGKVRIIKLWEKTKIVKEGKEARILDLKKGMEIRVVGIEEEGRVRALLIAAGSSEETMRWLDEMLKRGVLEYGGGIGTGE